MLYSGTVGRWVGGFLVGSMLIAMVVVVVVVVVVGVGSWSWSGRVIDGGELCLMFL